MDKNQDVKQEEISLVELIIIILRNWKIGLILFIIFYILAVSIFVYKKKDSLFFKPSNNGTDVLNQVWQGYTWVNNLNNLNINKDKELFDEYTPVELVSLLFEKGNLQNKFKNFQNLRCVPSGGIVQIFREQELLFNLTINADNYRRTFEFTATLPSDEIRKSRKFSSNEDINKIHDIVIDTLIDVVGDNVKTYKIIRNEIISGLAVLATKKYKTNEEMEYFNNLSQLFKDYRSPAREFKRSQINVYVPHPVAVLPPGGISLPKFLLSAFFLDLMGCLILIYLYDFFSKSNFLSEVQKNLKK